MIFVVTTSTSSTEQTLVLADLVMPVFALNEWRFELQEKVTEAADAANMTRTGQTQLTFRST